MGAALPIVQLILQFGIPAALEIAKLWQKQQPDNVEVGEWVILLTILSKGYDNYVPQANPNAPFTPSVAAIPSPTVMPPNAIL